MAILETKEISVYFGNMAALSDISVSIEEGEILGLIGPNGAGKTTFFNCVSGYLNCSAGAIYFKGKDITSDPTHRLCHLGICRTFQIVQNFQEMTVLENVMMGAFCRYSNPKKAARMAEEIIDFSGMAEKKEEIAGSLTLADQKRIELARAIATEPEVLLLDEVMAGLNNEETEQALALIRKVNEKGLTIIVVEHIMEAIMKISHRIVVLDSGELIANGPPEEVVQDARVVKAYLGEEYHA